MVRHNYSVDVFRGERDKVGVNRGGIVCGGMVAGVEEELMSTFWVK